MKVPQYIQEAIERRKRAAYIFVSADLLISDWLDKHGIECEYTHCHAECIANPTLAANLTFDTIAKHQESKN